MSNKQIEAPELLPCSPCPWCAAPADAKDEWGYLITHKPACYWLNIHGDPIGRVRVNFSEVEQWNTRTRVPAGGVGAEWFDLALRYLRGDPALTDVPYSDDSVFAEFLRFWDGATPHFRSVIKSVFQAAPEFTTTPTPTSEPAPIAPVVNAQCLICNSSQRHLHAYADHAFISTLDLEVAKREFLNASIAVWREIDRLSALPDGYHGLPQGTDPRKRELAAWEAFRGLLDTLAKHKPNAVPASTVAIEGDAPTSEPNDLVSEARALLVELKQDRTSAFCKAVTHIVVTAKTENLIAAMADGLERLYADSAEIAERLIRSADRSGELIMDLQSIQSCDKCDLCEDHHK